MAKLNDRDIIDILMLVLRCEPGLALKEVGPQTYQLVRHKKFVNLVNQYLKRYGQLTEEELDRLMSTPLKDLFIILPKGGKES